MRDIPTFQNQRVTNIPNMGIVQQSGLQAVGSAMQERAKVFDVIGDYANKKADERMAREQKIAAEEAVLAGGLDPATLKNPYSKADQIYREAALNTYAIQVEDNIETNLNRFALESRNDPNGYALKAEKFMSGTVSNLAPELKAPVTKYASSKIRSDQFTIQRQVQAQVLAENQAAEAAALEKLKADMVNAPAAERDQYYAKMTAIVGSSQHTLTAEGKQAIIQGIEKDVAQEIVLRDVMKGDMSIPAAEKALIDAGIIVSPSVKQQLYSSSMLEHNYAMAQKAQRDAAKQASLDGVQDQFYRALLSADLTNEPMDELTVIQLQKEAVKTMAASGASAESILKFKNTSLNTFYGSQNESQDFKALVEDKIARGDPDAKEFVTQGVREGILKKSTAIGLMRNAELAINEIFKTPEYVNYEATTLRRQYPKAFYTAEQIEAYKSDPTETAKIQAEMNALSAFKNEAILAASDPENPRPIGAFVAEKKGLAAQVETDGVSIDRVPMSPIQQKVYTDINSEEPVLNFYTPATKETNSIIPLTPSETKKIIPDTPAMKDASTTMKLWGEGRFTKENARTRILLMMQQNQKYKTKNPDGTAYPYDYKYINDIMTTFQISKENLK
jgi:hypothetical protein